MDTYENTGKNPTDLLRIGPHTFHSRLMTGTGKYCNADEMNAALMASGREVVTVALRRIDLFSWLGKLSIQNGRRILT